MDSDEWEAKMTSRTSVGAARTGPKGENTGGRKPGLTQYIGVREASGEEDSTGAEG